jgi:hypothetical protein
MVAQPAPFDSPPGIGKQMKWQVSGSEPKRRNSPLDVAMPVEAGLKTVGAPHPVYDSTRIGAPPASNPS